MNNPAETSKYSELLGKAQEHMRTGSVINAMQVYYDLHELDPSSRNVLTQLVGINLHLELTDQAIINLQKLIVLDPTNSDYHDQLAMVYASKNDWKQACDVYYGLTLRRPGFPDGHYNLGYYLRKAGRFESSIESYKRALKHKISEPEETYLNMAVVLADDLRKEDEAEKCLNKALKLNPKYLPALYNLANLYEDRGDRKRSSELFERILAINTDNARALARLANVYEAGPEKDSVVSKLEAIGKSEELSRSDKADVYYALGGAHDAGGNYDDAFRYYATANALNAGDMRPYDQEAARKAFDDIIENVSESWVRINTREGEESPIFICGMFRSGSTLVEQILAAHPAVTPGGERDDLVREFGQRRLQFPTGLDALKKTDWQQIAESYLERSASLFPDAKLLTDKRPDNFLHVGILKALFPKAKIIYTTRQPLDNCLSIFFVRLGRAMNYSVDLNNIAHYYDQQVRLLAHWQSIFGDEIHVVDYDQLIQSPKPQVESLLEYMGLDWSDNCLKFHNLRNTVKTASVWQVRKPLYTSSSGRWKNYQSLIQPLVKHYGANESADPDDQH